MLRLPVETRRCIYEFYFSPEIVAPFKKNQDHHQPPRQFGRSPFSRLKHWSSRWPTRRPSADIVPAPNSDPLFVTCRLIYNEALAFTASIDVYAFFRDWALALFARAAPPLMLANVTSVVLDFVIELDDDFKPLPPSENLFTAWEKARPHLISLKRLAINAELHGPRVREFEVYSRDDILTHISQDFSPVAERVIRMCSGFEIMQACCLGIEAWFETVLELRHIPPTGRERVPLSDGILERIGQAQRIPNTLSESDQPSSLIPGWPEIPVWRSDMPA